MFFICFFVEIRTVPISSGCACIATVFSGYIYKQLKEKKLKRILLIATGALTNATTAQQGETIPGIAHAVAIEI